MTVDDTLKDPDEMTVSELDAEIEAYRDALAERWGVDRSLISADDPAKARAREFGDIAIKPGDHPVIELGFTEALDLLMDLSRVVNEQAHERCVFTVPEWCPMCEQLDATPALPDGLYGDWHEAKHWLRDERGVHVTGWETEVHYSEHMPNRAMVRSSGIDPWPHGGDDPASEIEEAAKLAAEDAEDAGLLDREPTEAERDIVEALEFRGTYTAGELAESSARPRRTVYDSIDGLVEARVLRRLGDRPTTYEATGECRYRGLEAPSPPETEQLTIWRAVSDQVGLGDLLE